MVGDILGLYGRVSRVGWWLRTGLIAPLVLLIGLAPMFTSAGELSHLSASQQELFVEALSGGDFVAVERLTSKSFVTALYVLFAFWALAQWINIAATVRRFHDRNKTGLWTLISFIPLIGPLWLTIECGFLASEDADNRFEYSGAQSRQSEVFQALGERIETVAQQQRQPARTTAPVMAQPASAPTQRRNAPVGAQMRAGRSSFGRKPA